MNIKYYTLLVLNTNRRVYPIFVNITSVLYGLVTPAPYWLFPIGYSLLAIAAVGPGGGAPKDFTKPQQIMKSRKKLYKAPTDYTKPQNITQSQKKLYKDMRY